MSKRFQVIMAVVVAIMALTALSAGVVTAQQDGKATWNPSVTQSVAAYCGNALCTGDCDGSCNGTCNGNCTTDGTCSNGSCLQGTIGCTGGSCSQASIGRIVGQAGCRSGGSCR